jgi:hypothetical protein
MQALARLMADSVSRRLANEFTRVPVAMSLMAETYRNTSPGVPRKPPYDHLMNKRITDSQVLGELGEAAQKAPIAPFGARAKRRVGVPANPMLPTVTSKCLA